jgi:hypothetical protein
MSRGTEEKEAASMVRKMDEDTSEDEKPMSRDGSEYFPDDILENGYGSEGDEGEVGWDANGQEENGNNPAEEEVDELAREIDTRFRLDEKRRNGDLVVSFLRGELHSLCEALCLSDVRTIPWESCAMGDGVDPDTHTRPGQVAGRERP